jgi:glucosamine--fructose-6-phosphate aminotransferase (isomerizing)
MRHVGATQGGLGDSVAHGNDIIWIPPCPELISPILAVIPLQLFAYHVAALRGEHIDQPRNLAKTVTVE